MLRFLLTREVAQDPPSNLRRAQNTRATCSLSPSPSFSLKSRHYGAVNALDVEGVENRYLLSAGADAIINLWDLEIGGEGGDGGVVVDTLSTTSLPTTATPSSVRWWTGDTGMFSTTHHDHSLLIWDTNTFSTAACFPLGPEAPIRTHAPSAHPGVNPVIAVALASPGVRLVDLRTSSAAHTLTSPYSRSGTLDVAWSPRSPHHIASTHDDGTLRLWDIRRASPLLHTTPAHSSGATGVEWTRDGRHVVTAGWDGKMRVWDMERGRDCVVNFGPWITNVREDAKGILTRSPVCLPAWAGGGAGEGGMLVWPGAAGGQVLLFEIMTGRLIRRLRPRRRGGGGGGGRVVGMAVREGVGGVEVYAGNETGGIEVWGPSLGMEDDEGEVNGNGNGSGSGRPNVLDEVYEDATTVPITMR
ncbi:hypothetical protein YB2330_003939 [Saitoella coloradoensis]